MNKYLKCMQIPSAILFRKRAICAPSKGFNAIIAQMVYQENPVRMADYVFLLHKIRFL